MDLAEILFALFIVVIMVVSLLSNLLVLLCFIYSTEIRKQVAGRCNAQVEIKPTCTDIVLGYCDDMPYTKTMYPNLLDNRNREAVETSAEYVLLSVLHTLLKGECTPDLRMLGCSILAPRCEMNKILKPCRSSCEMLMKNCMHAFEAIEMAWPYFLDCDRFFVGEEEGCYDPLESLRGCGHSGSPSLGDGSGSPSLGDGSGSPSGSRDGSGSPSGSRDGSGSSPSGSRDSSDSSPSGSRDGSGSSPSGSRDSSTSISASRDDGSSLSGSRDGSSTLNGASPISTAR
ncbi:UNVERIFIED_CONTAM: hypothetical protein FKN15_043809 [Acipenser sinensis]